MTTNQTTDQVPTWIAVLVCGALAIAISFALADWEPCQLGALWSHWCM